MQSSLTTALRRVMKMLNSVCIMGRLTKDPELKSTQSGISVTSFSIAVDRSYKGPGGERETDFFDVVAWRSTADFVCSYFSKGRMAVIEGKLQARSWEDKNGAKRKTVEIVADSVYFGDSKKDGDSGGAYQARNSSNGFGNVRQAQAPEPEYTDMDIDDGDLPF